MASTLMRDDRLQIDRFNPTTWTGDFGINSGGFRKDAFIDGSYTTAIDEAPTDYTDDLALKPRDLSGNVYLKTIDPNYAPHAEFPTRKMEFSDGRVTWFRPELPWTWMDKDQTIAGFKVTKQMRRILLVLIVLAIIAYLMSWFKI